MMIQCQRCPSRRSNVVLDERENVCWACYNAAVKATPGKVRARTSTKPTAYYARTQGARP